MKGPDICPPESCTGCTACANICPKNCIEMVAGEGGSIHPVVDEAKCIDCKLCYKTCPHQNEVSLRSPRTAYAAWHNNHEDYLTSTSGGAATAFAQSVISWGGVVYGCCSGHDLDIRHIRIERTDEIHLLKGSKYVQSEIGLLYKQVLSDLKTGRKVLFIGTPCQVAGIRSFLKKDYDNFYCADLICHGVPSQAQLKEHIKYVAGNKADLVQFRKGNDMGLRIFDKNGNMIYYSNVWIHRYKDSYYGAFINGYSYRESCYSCRYACGKRVSDVTIGDFWGLSSEVKHDSVNGCSCILPTTDKGEELVRSSNLNLIERPVEEAINGNSQLRHPSRKSDRAKFYRRLVPIVGYEMAYKVCEIDRFIDHRLIKPIRRRIRL